MKYFSYYVTAVCTTLVITVQIVIHVLETDAEGTTRAVYAVCTEYINIY